MEHNNGSGSSEDLKSEINVANSIKDEDPLDYDKMVARASSSSFSSSSSSSSSHPLEINGGEKDLTCPESKENESTSRRSNSNPESPSTTPKTSSSQETGRTIFTLSPMASPRFSDSDTVNLSPKQSPPIQVMAQSDGYDPNRIPSSIFAPKQSKSESEWSVASDESLFSIQMGNNSFTLDSDLFISKSGKVHWLDDGFEYSCFTPNGSLASPLSMTVETTAVDERKSTGTTGEPAEKELLENLNGSAIKSVTEKESLPDREGRRSSSPNPDGIGASPSERTRNSDESSESANSFAFPLLAGGSPKKEDAEKPESPLSTPPTPKGAAEAEAAAPATTPKAGGNQWFNCFSCFPICC